MRNLFTQSLWHNTLIPLIIFENSIIAFTIKVSIQETYECGKYEILFISVVWNTTCSQELVLSPIQPSLLWSRPLDAKWLENV